MTKLSVRGLVRHTGGFPPADLGRRLNFAYHPSSAQLDYMKLPVQPPSDALIRSMILTLAAGIHSCSAERKSVPREGSSSSNN